MKGILILGFAASFLLFLHHVDGSDSLCKSEEATSSLLACRNAFVKAAGENFTDDCEDGVVKSFMRCITEVEGCKNVSSFTEKTLYEHYGCMDTSIRVYKRSWVRRLVCRVVCGVSCGYACSYVPFVGTVCRYVCGRVCRTACEWVWQWVSDRFGRDLSQIGPAPEESDDLTPEEMEYIEHSQNLCSNCVCEISVDHPPRTPELPERPTEIKQETPE